MTPEPGPSASPTAPDPSHPPAASAIKMRVEKPVYGGDCLAHLPASTGKPGKTVFVPLTLPGEEISAHLTEEKRSFAKAELDEIVTPSLHRVAPSCPHFGVCGGCSYQHADYPTQLDLKRQILAETLARAGARVPAEIRILSANPWAYRNRIRLALLPSGFGYRSRRSHAIVPITICPIAAPNLIEAARRFVPFLSQQSAPFPIQEIELFTDPQHSQVLLTLLIEGNPNDASVHHWLANLQRDLPIPDAALSLRSANDPAAPLLVAAGAPSSLTYTAAGFDYRVDHGAFFQVNRWLIDQFVSLVTAQQSGQLAWDLYAGVGLFARALTRSFASVLAVESSPASFPALEHNLAGTAGTAMKATTLDFLRRNREQREPRPDLIVLDPPRAGLGEETTHLLNAIHPPAMVYVSCDPATLARDLAALTQERFTIDAITLVDMFPQTFHIETVVALSSRK